MKKRLFSLALASVMALSLAGCGGSKEAATEAETKAETEQTAEDTSAKAEDTTAQEETKAESEAASEAVSESADVKFKIRRLLGKYRRPSVETPYVLPFQLLRAQVLEQQVQFSQ